MKFNEAFHFAALRPSSSRLKFGFNSVIGFIFCFILALNINPAHSAQLPDLGSPDLIEYDSITEKKLGQAFTYALHTEYPILSDPNITQYIRDIGHRIASFSGNNRDYSFYVINDPAINAFAGPDGVIGIHTGLIAAVRNEDELAGVIAHEISHVTQNHLSRRYEYNSTQGTINSLASFIAAVLIGSQDPSAGMAVLMGGMGLNMQERLKNSRQHESEADALGIELLNKAGYNPHAMASFFGHLNKQAASNSQQIPEILRTHPTSAHRLAEAQNRAQQLSNDSSTLKSLKQPSQLALIQSRLMKLQSVSTTSHDINFDLITTTEPKSDFDHCYTQALSVDTIDSNLFQCLDNEKLHSSQKRQASYLLLQNHKKLNRKQLDRLKQQTEYRLDLYPNDIALHQIYASFLQSQGKIQAAEQVLKSIQNIDYQYEVQQNLASFYQGIKKPGYAYFSLAKSYLAVGSQKRAEYYLKQAKTLAKGNINLENGIKKFIEKHDIRLNSKDI